jgi:uncharacterized protein YjbJ (UPF0337 family)
VATNRPTNKVKTQTQKAKGKVKQTVGRATHDNGMRASGIADEAKAEIKEVAGKAREIVKDAGEKVGDMARDARERLRH